MDAAAHRLGEGIGIESRRGQGGMPVEPLVEVEEEAVHRLQRIVGRRRFLIVGRRTAGHGHAKRQDHKQIA